MAKQSAILLVGQIPPPYHGQAEATKILFDHDWPGLRVVRLQMAYSLREVDVGGFGIRKLFHLCKLIAQTWWLLIRHRPCFLYYPPASPNLLPVLRDIVYLLAVRLFAKGVIFHYHPGGLPRYVATLNPVLRFLARIAYGKAAVSIVISEDGVDPAVAFRARKRHCVPNGLDVPEGGVSDKVPPGGGRILYMAGLRKTKGVMDLLETAATLKARGIDFVMDVAGTWQEGGTRRRFEKMLEQKDLGGVIRMHGRVTGEEKWQLYRDASAFFFPSYYESENFPLVLIEAMAFGLPIVATRWRGISEMVVEGATGRLCEVGKIEGFADALQSLADDPHRYAAMSRAARARYEANYTKAAFLEGMRKAFEAAVGRAEESREGGLSWQGQNGLRVLQVFNRYLQPGGEEASVARIANHLEQGGHTVRRFWKSSEEWRGRGAPPKLLQPFLLNKNRKVLKELEAAHREFSPDIWILHNPLPVISLGVYSLALSLDVPIVHWIHNYRPISPSGVLRAGEVELEPDDPRLVLKEARAGAWRNSRVQTAWLAWRYAKIRRRGDFESVKLWIAISDLVRETFIKAGWYPERVETLHYAWTPGEIAKTPKESGYFLFLGRIVPEKGIRFLLELFAQPELAHLKLKIAGQGPNEPEFRKASPPNVEWIGYLQGAEKSQAIRGAKVVLFPSLWKEPFGLVVYEAFEQARAIFASDVAGMRDVIEDGVSGRVLPADNLAAWTAAIFDFTAAEEMGAAGRQWLENEASVEVWCEKFEELVESKIGISPAP